MKDNMDRKNPGAKGNNPPKKTTTDNFKLNLTDEIISTGTVRGAEESRGERYNTASFHAKKGFMSEKERKKA